MANRKANLNLEGLTDRVVPAVSGISFLNGSLSIRLDNQTGTLTVLGGTATNASNYKLEYNGNPVGNASGYNVTNSITIMGGNGNDTVEFEAQGAAAYRIPGNLTINLGNGNDTVTSKGAFTVNGSANINVGNGSDTIDFSNNAATDSTTVNGSLTVNMLAGNDTLTANTGAFTVNGFTTINGGNDIQLKATGATTAVTGASVLLNSVTINSTAGETFANSLETAEETLLRGNLVFISGSFTDTVGIDGSTILGNATLNLGQGGSAATKQTVTLSATNPTTVNGNLTVISGNGVDEITFDTAAGTTINGSVTLNLGNGNNNIVLGGDGTSVIGGALTILTGTGDDTVAIGAAGDAFTINGSASINLGNSITTTAGGGNEVTFVSAVINGNLSYTGGTSADTIEFTDDAIANVVGGMVSINTGGGADTVNIDQAAAAGAGTTSFGSLYVNFGVGSGPDVFANNSGIDFDIFIYNFVP
jgi:uncharacterized protein YaiE (UPF0345 family)